VGSSPSTHTTITMMPHTISIQKMVMILRRHTSDTGGASTFRALRYGSTSIVAGAGPLIAVVTEGGGTAATVDRTCGAEPPGVGATADAAGAACAAAAGALSEAPVSREARSITLPGVLSSGHLLPLVRQSSNKTGLKHFGHITTWSPAAICLPDPNEVTPSHLEVATVILIEIAAFAGGTGGVGVLLIGPLRIPGTTPAE